MTLPSPPTTSLVFKVHRHESELISPAKPTPHEFKPLSDIDDQKGLRFQIPFIQFYPNNNFSMQGNKDPVKVIREALAKALVFYYPFAGRLREGPNRKLILECTGEGVLFIEADADVSLEEFGDTLQPPFPCFEELLFDVPGSSGMLHCPLLLIQVTRLKCGGFIFAVRFNHAMSDGPGLVQFLSAVAEMARGSNAPFIFPVWERHIFTAADPPHVTLTHHEYDEVEDIKGTFSTPPDNLAFRLFHFGPNEISYLKKSVPPHLSKCSTFELVTACIWRCRTIALQPDPSQEMRIICAVSARNMPKCPTPKGYYGNNFVNPAAVTTAGKLSRNPLGYALELVKNIKENVTEEYMKSVTALLVTKGRPHFSKVGSYVVSDLRHLGFNRVDFGWGKALYGGAAMGVLGSIPGMSSFYLPFTNKKGEKGMMVPLYLPAPAMERFVKELDNMLKHQVPVTTPKFIISAL